MAGKRDFLNKNPQTTWPNGSIPKYDSSNDVFIPEDGPIPSYANVVLQTDEVLHAYIDSSRPDDTGDGLSWGAAKKTLSAGMAVLPDVISYNTCLHIKGTFTNETLFVNRQVVNGAMLVVAGDEDYSVEWGPQAADIHSTSSIGLTTAGWTPDAYMGYFVQVLDGGGDPLYTYAIQENTATTITPVKNFPLDPGTANFRIVKPATTIAGTSSCGLALSGNVGRQGISDSGYIVVQDIRLAGSASVLRLEQCTYIWLTHLVIESTTTYPLIMYNSSFVGLGGDKINLSSFAWVSQTSYYCGVAKTGSNTVLLSHVAELYIGGSVIQTLVAGNCGIKYWTYGNRFSGVELRNCRGWRGSVGDIGVAVAGFAKTKFYNSSNYGLKLISSDVNVDSSADFSSNSEHGLIAENSRINFIGAASGSGNGGAGLYAHSGSQVTIKSGSPPTLTGTVGDIAVVDPNYEDATWTEIDSGEPFRSAAESTAIKEVP